jgi:hypothetical protein
MPKSTCKLACRFFPSLVQVRSVVVPSPSAKLVACRWDESGKVDHVHHCTAPSDTVQVDARKGRCGGGIQPLLHARLLLERPRATSEEQNLRRCASCFSHRICTGSMRRRIVSWGQMAPPAFPKPERRMGMFARPSNRVRGNDMGSDRFLPVRKSGLSLLATDAQPEPRVVSSHGRP